MQHDHSLKKLNIWPYDPTPGGEDVCKDKLYSFMVLYIPISFNLTCNIRRKTCFDFLVHPWAKGMCVGYHIAARIVSFDIQHDRIFKIILALASPPKSAPRDQTFKLKFLISMFHIDCFFACD